MTVATLGYTMVICGNSDDPQHRYRGRIEKVKFGVPIEEAFAHDIPATLLVLLLKVHKDGPAKKDIWRAPGNQAQVRKLSHIMQHGRLVNIANFSVYTAASVIKKFLSKLPGGIFGVGNEQKLFDLYNISSDLELQRQSFCRVLSSLPIPSQHLLVLLFGTFYMISESADSFGSRMTTEALGISVAPSLFHSCIHDGQRAKIEDVIRFKIASEIISRIIENFGYTNLFPQESYEFYARITGRTLRFDENDSRLRFVTPANVHDWPVPSPSTYSIMAAQCAGRYSMSTVAAIDHISSNCVLPESHSQSDMVLMSADAIDDRSAVDRNYRCYSRRQTQSTSHHGLRYKRLSSSAAEVQHSHSDDDEKYSLNVVHGSGLLESTHSLTYLEWVHERQTRRMRTRSEWFLLPASSAKNSGTSQLSASEFSSTSMLQPYSQFDDSTVRSRERRTESSDNADECLINVTRKLPLSKTCEGAITSSSINVSGELPAATQPAMSPTSRIAGGIVRRRSWRTHYVRPNRIVESGNKERDSSEVTIISCRSAPLYRRNVPNTCSRSLPGTGQPILLPSSLIELQQQRQKSGASSPEFERRYYPKNGSDSSISHGRRSKTVSQFKNVHF
ncbi:RhoGAP domain containing protein [Brugia malayi]|uniref:Bm1668 n=2 Tax=Brugia TaxID=6278 RepID=A0A0J9XYF4_BRUMA|nr:RhoGAP domain containing protein [Brugia malayi]CDP97739.2 Bm1668 [Brugia malayi]VIO93255.1 RhoGAP domain containing protein [Brugia malayi]